MSQITKGKKRHRDRAENSILVKKTGNKDGQEKEGQAKNNKGGLKN